MAVALTSEQHAIHRPTVECLQRLRHENKLGSKAKWSSMAMRTSSMKTSGITWF